MNIYGLSIGLTLLLVACAEEQIQKKPFSVPTSISSDGQSILLKLNISDRETLDEDDIQKTFFFTSSEPLLRVMIKAFPHRGLSLDGWKILAPLIQVYDENHRAIQVQKLQQDRTVTSSDDGTYLERVWELAPLNTNKRYSLMVYSDPSLVGKPGLKRSVVPSAYTDHVIASRSSGAATLISTEGPFEIMIYSQKNSGK